MRLQYCNVCGEYGHTVHHVEPPAHQHAPSYTLDLNPNPRMACEDCAWSARGEDGWLACQALEHSTQNPGHRLRFEPGGHWLREDQLPPSDRFAGGVSE